MTEETNVAIDDEQAERAEKKGKTRFDWSKLIIILFTAIASAAIGYGFNLYSGRMRVMKYTLSSSSGIIQKPEIVGKTLAVTLDGKPIENLSSIAVFIMSTDQDLVDVPIYLRFAAIDGHKPKLLQVIPKLAHEWWEEIPVTDAGDNALRYGFKIKVWNRNQVVQFDTLFEGDKAPQVIVDTMQKGVTTQWVPMETKEANSDTYRWVVGVLSAVLGLVLGYFFRSTKDASEENKKLRRELQYMKLNKSLEAMGIKMTDE